MGGGGGRNGGEEDMQSLAKKALSNMGGVEGGDNGIR
jgi:hypothetical protein